MATRYGRVDCTRSGVGDLCVGRCQCGPCLLDVIWRYAGAGVAGDSAPLERAEHRLRYLQTAFSRAGKIVAHAHE